MKVAVKVLVAGLPAEIVREIGLRLRDVTITEFDDAHEMGEAVSSGEARLALLSDSLAAEDSLHIATRAKDGAGATQVAYCISMRQAENGLKALREARIDRFFLTPVDVEEMLRELAKMCDVEVLPRHASHEGEIAAAVVQAWDRARASTFEKVDKLDDAAIALLENALTREMAATASRESRHIGDIAIRFGFQKGAAVARDLAEHFAAGSLSPAEGVSIAEQLLLLRQELATAPCAPIPTDSAQTAPLDSRESGSGDSEISGMRVLVVDDELMISRGLTSLLERRGLEVTALNDPLRFWSAIDETKPNLVLLDLEMPKINGTELCRAIRGDARWSETPVVFLTGYTDQASVHRIFAAGADDYIGKPFVPAELTMRLENRLTGARARRPPVETDPLTGLATGRKATELIDRFLRLARRKSDPYSIAVLQVDNFAMITRTHGRTMSDVVLRAIGELLPKSFRGEDVAAWWGEADFTVGMYGSTKEQAALKLAQICLKIADLDFLSPTGKKVHVTCSGGVAEYQVDGETVAALREEAASALAQARDTSTRVGISGTKAAGPLLRKVDVAIALDDGALVSLLQHAMETRNLRVATFGDGETAAAALTGPTPEIQASVILLGVDLPALSGLDVLRRLKAGHVTRSSSVVMLTARAGENDILAALELGAIDHVSKPFSVPVLMHKVRTVLKQARI